MKLVALNTTISRNPGLDVLRALCLFLVVLQHSFMFTDLFYPKFRMFWIISHPALDLFFILSGFLIGGIIENKFRKNGAITLKDIAVFYKRRWLKTMPMYFLTIAVCLLLSYLNIYYAKDFSWKFLVFLQNLYSGSFNFLPHTYSLTIEEWFYIFFPLGLLCLLKFKNKIRVNPFYLLIIMWIVIAISFRVVRHLQGVGNWDAEIRKAILTRMDATIYGVLIYFIHLNKTTIIRKYRIALLFLGCFLYLICTVILRKEAWLFFNDVTYYTIVPFFMSLLLPFFIYLRLPLFLEKSLAFQSLASYSIYLIHLPLLYIIYKYFEPHSGTESLILIPVAVILAYILGSLLYKLIEKPIMDLRDRY